ncbi:hypothetical protein AB9P05_08570 [Roseivirga sp. BDSF3-8]|uniref:hypothetical protein n=1 Tax=Roseivirga sp. BDSF3-8 TaxID=3241598 RepID=UPI003531BCD8
MFISEGTHFTGHTSIDSLVIFYSQSKALDEEEVEDHFSRLENHIEKLQKKRGSGPATEFFLSKLFYKTHKKFLRNYKAVVAYDRLILSGDYNCISGTALYAVVFDALEIPYTIYESDDHVFLMVQAGEERYLIESTDPLNGFIADETIIARHVENISNGLVSVFPTSVGSSEGLAQGKPGVQELPGLAALAGLQYYNEAVIHYREGKLSEAYRLALRGYQFYPSKRLKLCLDTILDAIVTCADVSEETKRRLYKQYITFVNKSSSAS